MGVSLQNELPKSVSDLIAALPEADNFMVKDFNIRNITQKDDLKKFFGTAFAQYIPGFLDAVPEFIHSPYNLNEKINWEKRCCSGKKIPKQRKEIIAFYG